MRYLLFMAAVVVVCAAGTVLHMSARDDESGSRLASIERVDPSQLDRALRNSDLRIDWITARPRVSKDVTTLAGVLKDGSTSLAFEIGIARSPDSGRPLLGRTSLPTGSPKGGARSAPSLNWRGRRVECRDRGTRGNLELGICTFGAAPLLPGQRTNATISHLIRRLDRIVLSAYRGP